MTLTVAQEVGRLTAEAGATHVFGVVGSGNFHLTNAMVNAGMTFVAARHEQGAAVMADAHARMTGTPAVVSLHQGCGLTNALTGITEAAKSRTPLVVLSADAPAKGPSNFRIAQDELAVAVGAVALRVTSADHVAEVVGRAFAMARARRTVVVSIPIDVQEVELLGPLTFPEFAPPTRAAATDADLQALARILLQARRPVFIAGRGARAGDAAARITAVADAIGALVGTSAVARGLFEGHPWNLDVAGGFSTPLTAQLIREADVVVAWGCALNMWTTRHGKLIGPDTTVVQIDDDAAAIGVHAGVALGVVADVADVAERVLDHVVTEAGGVRSTRIGYRSAELQTRLRREGRWADVPFVDAGGGERIDPRTLSIRLNQLLPSERVIGVDSGNFLGYPSMYLDVPDANSLCFTQAFQCVGLGLATAIGAVLAQPQRLGVAALGDGGALMGIAELETVGRLGLPMVVVVYNDAMYGAEVHHFAPGGDDLSTVTFPDTDFAAIARGYGLQGVTVREPGDLDALADWLAGDRPTAIVLDAKVARPGPAWWLAEAFGH